MIEKHKSLLCFVTGSSVKNSNIPSKATNNILPK